MATAAKQSGFRSQSWEECCGCGRAKCFHKSPVVGEASVQKHSSASRTVCVSSAAQMDRQDKLARSSKSNKTELCSY